MSQNYLSSLEELIMLAILSLNNDAYGVSIKSALEEKAGYKISYGSLYASLEGLERKGFVETRMGEPTSERGGRAKKFCRVTGTGASSLVKAEQARLQLGYVPTGVTA